MTSRNVDGTTYAMDYDPENRLTSISGGTLTARYVFDGDGRRVLSVVGDTRTLYVNEYFEVQMANDVKVNQDLTIVPVDICENRYCVFIPLAISDIEAIGMSSGNFGMATLIPQGMQPDSANVTWRVYYPGGALRVQTTTGDVLSYLVQDHLNSTALTINTSGTITGEMVYSAWGETRYSFGATPTDRLYTGQYEAEAALYFYNSRWYDNQLGRFVQADSIVPEPGNPMTWDRYAYVDNAPINNTDPSGHYIIEGDWQDPNSGTYSAGYNQHGNTVLLSLISSKAIYGVKMPIRVSYATLIDPYNEFGIYEAGIVLGMVDTGKSILPGSFSSRPINSIPKNLIEDVIQEQFVKSSINAPTNPRLLRQNMIKAGNVKPLDMVNPNAHHGLPWKYREWFASRGLDVNDPQFGYWVEARPHSQWSWEYNNAWRVFIKNEPFASPQMISEYMWQLMSGEEFLIKW
jgi:RHS repeat-associated protein